MKKKLFVSFLCPRPVLAILDIDIVNVDEKKRGTTLQQVIAQQGPPDGTVVVTLAGGSEFEDGIVNSVIEALGSCGEIILVR